MLKNLAPLGACDLDQTKDVGCFHSSSFEAFKISYAKALRHVCEITTGRLFTSWFNSMYIGRVLK